MATYDLTKGGTTGHAFANVRGPYKLEKSIDFSATNYAQNDVLQLFDIPANSWVAFAQITVTTAEGGTLTFDLGDGSDVDGFIDGANGNSTGTTGMALALTEGAPNTVTGYSNGKLYTAADTIDLTVLGGAADTAVIEVVVLVFDVS